MRIIGEEGNNRGIIREGELDMRDADGERENADGKMEKSEYRRSKNGMNEGNGSPGIG